MRRTLIALAALVVIAFALDDDTGSAQAPGTRPWRGCRHSHLLRAGAALRRSRSSSSRDNFLDWRLLPAEKKFEVDRRQAAC